MSLWSSFRLVNMSRAVVLEFVIALLVFTTAAGHNVDSESQGAAAKSSNVSPVTTTPAGVVQGSWMSTRQGRRFEAYRGIRYAEPPIGQLRFQPPVPITQYSSPVDAREDGPACPQPTNTPGFVVDEDCLRLNVYTPRGGNSSSPLLPVLVYLHPGGFYSVAGRSDVAGPLYLLERDLVLVTINYRLASLGFLSTGDEHAPGNNGFKDQIAALRWIQSNIHAFGGDPNLVTLMGYSAGAFSIGLHMVSPMAKGLFHHAIMMSASPLSQVVIGTEQRHLAVRQAKLLGCPTHHNKDMVACLKTKPWKQFADSLPNMFEFGYDPVLLWNVVVEPNFGQERYLTEQPLETLTSGRAHTVPCIISQTTDEFFWKAFNVMKNATMFTTMEEDWQRIAPVSFMLPAKGYGAGAMADVAARTLKQAYFGTDGFHNDSRSVVALGHLYSDAVIGFAAHRMTRLMARYSPHPVYQYEFAYVGRHSHYEDPITKKPQGAAHHDELIYLLSVRAVFPDIPLDSPDNAMVSKLTALVYNFARYGDPSPRGDTPELTGLSWPRYTPDQRQYLRIGNNFSVHHNLFEERYQVWNQLYPVQY